MHRSIATISNPEFINLQPTDVSPLISSCEIKVLYLGQNRNHSYIDKEVATEMSKTLRGNPIVGYFNPNKDDFTDHGERIIMDESGIQFECLTVPYGFVSPDAEVWFQDFDDEDEFGNTITRTYLMTTGYLWTGQFEEAQRVIDEGRPHSMELDEETLDGHWATDQKTGIEFFIISDAIFSKLCILGEDVEPCFEGSSVTSKKFSLDDTFKQTLFTMMQDLNKIITSQKGGNKAMEEKEKTTTEFEVIEETEVSDEFACDNDEEKDKQGKAEEEDKPAEEEEEKNEPAADHVCEDKEEEDKKDEKYSLLKEENTRLAATIESLNSELTTLRAFKLEVENAKKDDMINSFYMLSDEDKAEVIANKDQYTCEQIEEKLSVICFRNKVSFSQDNTDDAADEPTVTFNLDKVTDSAVPEWVKAVRNNKGGNL